MREREIRFSLRGEKEREESAVPVHCVGSIVMAGLQALIYCFTKVSHDSPLSLSLSLQLYHETLKAL
jgi:hypothetical protein